MHELKLPVTWTTAVLATPAAADVRQWLHNHMPLLVCTSRHAPLLVLAGPAPQLVNVCSAVDAALGRQRWQRRALQWAILRAPLSLVGRYVVQTRCPADFAQLTLQIAPTALAAVTLTSAVDSARLPPEFLPPIRAALYDWALIGVSDGVPLTQLAVTLADALHHPVDSRPVSFYRATAQALRTAVTAEHLRLL